VGIIVVVGAIVVGIIVGIGSGGSLFGLVEEAGKRLVSSTQIPDLLVFWGGWGIQKSYRLAAAIAWWLLIAQPPPSCSKRLQQQ